MLAITTQGFIVGPHEQTLLEVMDALWGLTIGVRQLGTHMYQSPYVIGSLSGQLGPLDLMLCFDSLILCSQQLYN